MFAGVIGAVVGFLVTHLHVATDETERKYIDRPEYATWAGVVGLQVAAWFALATLAGEWRWRAITPNRAAGGRPRWQWIVSIAAGLGVMFAAPAVIMKYTFDHDPHWQFWRVVFMGGIVSVASAVVIEYLHICSVLAEQIDHSTTEAVNDFQALWRAQRQGLLLLGSFFTLVMIASGTKAQANDSFADYKGSFSGTYLLVTALFYVAGVLIAYLPFYFRIRTCGEGIAQLLAARDGARPVDLAYHDTLGKWRAVLGVDEDVRANLERGVLLLAPLVSALVGTVIKALGT